MDVLIANLDEARTGFGEQVLGNHEPITEIGQVGVDAEFPRVAEGFDLLHLAGGILDLAVLDVALPRGYLPVAAELDAVRGIDVDHLDLAAQRFAFGQTRHDVEGIAEDHPVGPVGLVAIEVDEVQLAEAVEGVEEGQFRLVLRVLGGAAQVLDDDPRVDLLLDVDGRGVRDY